MIDSLKRAEHFLVFCIIFKCCSDAMLRSRIFIEPREPRRLMRREMVCSYWFLRQNNFYESMKNRFRSKIRKAGRLLQLSKGMRFRPQIWGVEIKKRRWTQEECWGNREDVQQGYALLSWLYKQLCKKHLFICVQGESEKFRFGHINP